jgi:hypothetical protein
MDITMQENIEQVAALIDEGLIEDSDARDLLEDIQRTLEIEDGSMDIALRGQLLTTVSTLLNLL